MDSYLIEANEGDTLVVTTTTPDGESGAPNNGLDPRLELYDSSGVRVAVDDNGGLDSKNSRFRYTVPTGSGGTYRIALLSAGGVGAYTLTVTGATGSPPPFSVASTDPS